MGDVKVVVLDEKAERKVYKYWCIAKIRICLEKPLSDESLRLLIAALRVFTWDDVLALLDTLAKGHVIDLQDFFLTHLPPGKKQHIELSNNEMSIEIDIEVLPPEIQELVKDCKNPAEVLMRLINISKGGERSD